MTTQMGVMATPLGDTPERTARPGVPPTQVAMSPVRVAMMPVCDDTPRTPPDLALVLDSAGNRLASRPCMKDSFLALNDRKESFLAHQGAPGTLWG